MPEELIRFVVRHDAGAGVTLAGLVVVFVLVLARHTAVKATAGLALAGLMVSGLWIHVTRNSEHGQWIALADDSSASDYVAFLKTYPAGTYAANARAVVRSRQEAYLQQSLTSVGRTIVEAIHSSPIPATISAHVTGQQDLAHPYGTTDLRRYEEAIDKIGELVASELRELVHPTGAEVRLVEDEGASEGVIFSVHYRAVLGPQYATTYGGVSSVALSAEWILTTSGTTSPVKRGEIGRKVPPARPGWEGKKFKEQVLADIVLEQVLADIAGVLGVSTPDLKVR